MYLRGVDTRRTTSGGEHDDDEHDDGEHDDG
jgi:hypothetical protein